MYVWRQTGRHLSMFVYMFCSVVWCGIVWCSIVYCLVLCVYDYVCADCTYTCVILSASKVTMYVCLCLSACLPTWLSVCLQHALKVWCIPSSRFRKFSKLAETTDSSQ